MEKIDWNRLVVVAALHGEKYIGFIPEETQASPQDYMYTQARENKPVCLYHVRTLISQPQMQTLANGQQVIAGFVAVIPFEFNPGPAEELWVRASSWHFPVNNPESQEKVQKLLDKAVESEAQIAELERQMDLQDKARDAGIITPNGMHAHIKRG